MKYSQKCNKYSLLMICKTQKKWTLRDKMYFIHTSCIPTKPFNCFMQSLRTRTTFNVLLYIINVFVNMIYYLVSVLHVLHSVLKRFALQDDPFVRIFHTTIIFMVLFCSWDLMFMIVKLRWGSSTLKLGGKATNDTFNVSRLNISFQKKIENKYKKI